MKKLIHFMGLISFCFLLCGCGCKSPISLWIVLDVSSEPNNAEIYINGSKIGITPYRFAFKLEKKNIIKIIMTGYKQRIYVLKDIGFGEYLFKDIRDVTKTVYRPYRIKNIVDIEEAKRIEERIETIKIKAIL